MSGHTGQDGQDGVGGTGGSGLGGGDGLGVGVLELAQATACARASTLTGFLTVWFLSVSLLVSVSCVGP